jgi:methylisocitrate lyase
MSQFGLPDIGLTTVTELVEQARRVANATSVPIVCDADTGYGNPLNVRRTVQALEDAGVAGIQLEDQVAPKRCGHFDGKSVISREEMVQKVHAALDARRDPDIVIIARTDARAVVGYEDAIERALAYREAGADAIFVEAPRTIDEMRDIAARIPAPLLINIVEGGKTPQLSFDDYARLGFRIVLYPTAAVRVTAKALDGFYRHLHLERTSTGFTDRMATFEERNEINDLAGYTHLTERYAASVVTSEREGTVQ